MALVKYDYLDNYRESLEECVEWLDRKGESREASLAKTKLEEAMMWLDRAVYDG